MPIDHDLKIGLRVCLTLLAHLTGIDSSLYMEWAWDISGSNTSRFLGLRHERWYSFHLLLLHSRNWLLCYGKPKPWEETTFHDSRQHPSVDVQEDNYIKARVSRWGMDWESFTWPALQLFPSRNSSKDLRWKRPFLAQPRSRTAKRNNDEKPWLWWVFVFTILVAVCWGQRATCSTSQSTMWVLGVGLRLPGLMAGASTHWAIPPSLLLFIFWGSMG